MVVLPQYSTFSLHIKLSFILVLLAFSPSTAQPEVGIIEGNIRDVKTKSPLDVATVTVLGKNLAAKTNSQGVFRIPNAPKGVHVLSIKCMGYEEARLKANIRVDTVTTITAYLQPIPIPLEEVVVTSTRSVKQFQDVPIPLSILTSSRIESLAPVTISDALRSEPGISLGRDGIWSTFINIRGLSKTNIILLVDGNRLDTTTEIAAGLSMIDVNDIERIEVIRGAGSTLYGTGATGGVVNVITRDGWYSDHLSVGGQFQGGFSSVNKLGIGQLSFNFSNGKFYSRFNSTIRSAQNTQTPQGMLKNSQFHDHSYSAQFGIQATKNQELKIIIQI